MTQEDVEGIRRAILALADQPTPTNTVLAARCNAAALQALRDLLITAGLFTLDDWEHALRPLLEKELRDGVLDLGKLPYGYAQPIVSTPRLGGNTA